MTDVVRVERPAEGVLWLRLHRPERRNALDRATLDALAERVSGCPPDVRVIVVSGDGTDFCAGYDLLEAHDRGAAGLVAHPESFSALAASPVPLVAALHGRVIGGGLELALCADLRIAARGTRLSMPASRIGLVYSDTGARLVVEAAGSTVARAMLLRGDELSARRARQVGLVTEVVGRRRLAAAALESAQAIAAARPRAARGNRRLLDVVTGRVDEPTDPLREITFESGELAETATAFAARHRRRQPVSRPSSRSSWRSAWRRRARSTRRT